MNISEIFIRRPIATALMTAGLFAFGALSFTLLPVAALPNVEFPTISVSAKFPGASPSVMASTVATPLEDQFTAIPGLSSMTSTSGLGSTSITLQFDLSTSITADAGYVEQAIQASTALLPKNLPTPPTYKVANPADAPILIYAVHSNAYPVQELDQYANILLGQSLSRVSGVGQVVIAGQAEPAVQVRLNPDALAAKGLGFAQVSAALNSQSALEPTGNLEGHRAQFPLDVNQQLTTADQFRKVIVAYSNGAPVELGDIATVVDGPQNPRTGAWFGPKRAEVLLVFKAPGANTLNVVDRIQAMMPQLKKSIPRAVHVDLVSDRSLSIRCLRLGRRVHPRAGARARRLGDLPLPAQLLGDRDPEHHIACRDRRDVWGDVPALLQHRQPLAHGAHDRDRVPCRRCDRDDREHRPPHRGGKAAA